MAGFTNITIKDGTGASQTIQVYDTGTGGPYANAIVLNDGTGNKQPAMDAVARPGFFKLTDGTNTAPTMDAVARPGFFKLTDGTNTAPTMDAAARAGFQKITDGTNTMPTGDAKARKVWVQPTDGTNDFLSGSSTNISAQTAINSLLVAEPGEWVVTHAPATNTQATASKAAGGAGVKHVCQGLCICLAAGGTAPTATQLTVNLRDGLTGAGTILAAFTVAITAVAGAFICIPLTDLNIVGSAATAMTLEFSAAGGANTYESVTLMGYDVS
jgi:hypothetical protein